MSLWLVSFPLSSVPSVKSVKPLIKKKELREAEKFKRISENVPRVSRTIGYLKTTNDFK